MKSFVAIVFFGLIAGAFTIPLTEEQIKKSQELVMKCAAKFNVEASVVQQLKNGDFSNSEESTQCFALCFLHEAGLVDEHGNQIESAIIEKLSLSAKKEKSEIKKVYDECKNVIGTSACNKSFEAYKCYRTKLQF